MKTLPQVGVLFFLLLQLSAAQTADIRLLHVGPEGDGVKIEVTLSAPVVPSVIMATRPDRLVLEFPNTVADAATQSIPVNHNGVQRIRVGRSQNPPMTRVVVDLDQIHPYGLAATGNTIALTVLPAEQSASRQWLGKLLRRKPEKDPVQSAVADVAQPSASESTPVFLVVRPQSQANLRMSFRVKYVAEGAAYLGGGRSSGLKEGMRLVVRDTDPSKPAVAELRVVSVADSSAVTEVRVVTRAVKPGDWAYLAADDYSSLQREKALKARKAPVMAIREGAPGDLPSTDTSAKEPVQSRISARVGLDYSGIHSSGSTAGRSSTLGMSIRTDMTSIGGTHWNLQGYWRGRLTHNSQPLEQTLQDYLDRTYTLQLYYDNPDSRWVAGVGRLYLPWAVSLDTIDGGYFGSRFHGGVAGVFAGSTPDPTSWHYEPDRRIAGTFVNFEGGSYQSLHYSSTSGVALSSLQWRLDRPFIFFENQVSYEKYISVYHSLIVDSPTGVSTDGIKPGAGISRSYLTFHIQPHPRISFDIYHNYFRDVPTAATALIGTGLVDKLLYQGLNVGVRVEPIRHVVVYTTIGQSNKTGDVRRSLNQMYGITWSEILHTGLRADIRYSKFDSSFARGDYRVLTLSRHLGDRMLWDAQVGSQSLNSPFTANGRSFFVDSSFDVNFGRHTYFQSGYTVERGAVLNYDQWYLSLGYRFDVREQGR